MTNSTVRQMLKSIQDIDDKNMFFIVGTEKSGTTWLQLLLDQHPNAACRGEGQFATQLLPLLKKATDEYNAFIANLNRKVFNEIEHFPCIDAATLQAIQTTAAGLLLSSYGSAPSVNAVGEKTPGHIRTLDQLHQLFPSAQFICILRDPRDIAVSGWYHLKRQYGDDKADPLPDYARRIAAVWKSDYEQYAVFADQHPALCRLMRYEDLHAQPREVVTGLFAFLGLDSSADVVERCLDASAFDKMTKGRERGQEDTRSHFRKGIVGDWVNHFDIAAWRACDEIAGTLLEQLGYARQWKPPLQAIALPRLSVKQTVRATAVQAKNVTPDSAYEKALQFMRRGRPHEAITAFEQLLKDQPRHASGWRLLGQVLKDQGRLQEAIDAYRQSLALQDDVPTRNVLVIALHAAGRTDEALIEGLRNLEHKDAVALRSFSSSPFKELQLTGQRRTFNPMLPQRNIIAFSLWGKDPTYLHGAIANARIAPNIYYGWTTRFYCDNSVPADTLAELKRHHAQIVLLEDPAWQRIKPMWRFLVSDDPNVDYFICRDADSRLNCQELLAVEDWLRSGKPFHAMRDHVYHMELILAGMWGGMAGVLPEVRTLIFGHPQYFNSRFGDQAFLMNVVWPLVRDQMLVHDSYYRFHESVEFPPGYCLPRPIHVGGAIKLASSASS